jgi:hypothetical protein
MGKYYNRKVKGAPRHRPRDPVILNGTNIKTRRPTTKLDFKSYGLFEAAKVKIPLKLPPLLRIHDVFHVSLLEPYRESQKGLHEKIIYVKWPKLLSRIWR